MPQMAPISWLILFIIFSISFIVFNMMNFYCFTPKISFNSQENVILHKNMKWKW